MTVKAPARELRVYANKQLGRIEIILLADGSPIGTINFSQEQAEQHARLLISAIEMLNEGKSKLILPGEIRPH